MTLTDGGAEALPRTMAAVSRGIEDGTHIGAQLHVDLAGREPIDAAVGLAAPGRDMTVDTLMPWFSATKAVTAVAALRRWAAGAFDLDDPVAAHLPEFAACGKDRIRVRHLFTHTAGIRTADELSQLDLSGPPGEVWDRMVAAACAVAPEDDWVPGARAGYHLGSGMLLLAEIVRRTSGRDFAAYVREEVFDPLGMDDCWLAVPPDRFAAYGDRMGLMHLTVAGEPTPFPLFNTPDHAALTVPGGGGRGPMRQLAEVYRSLRARDGRVLPTPVVEAMTARHRVGLFDETYGIHVDWGLGLMIDAISYGRHCSPRTFGHGGMQSSVAYCDPDAGLVVAMVFNGMPGNVRHYRRLEAVSSAIYEDLGLVAPGSAGRDHECPVEAIA